MREKEFLPLVREHLNIAELNAMQKQMLESATKQQDIILLSPTGSGKTLAFILPMLKHLKAPTGRVQAVVIAPSRELVIQIAKIIRTLAKGFKTTALYGGHNVEDETNSLSVTPDIIVATPGRLLDHINRRNADLLPCRILVLDEFDKSLELGFEKEMKKIVGHLKNVSRTILTSATDIEILPEFLSLKDTLKLDFTGRDKVRRRLRVHRVDADGKDKLESLLLLLRNIKKSDRTERTIIFVNHRESAERVAKYLRGHKVDAVLYHGALEQQDREKAVTMFNNGSRPILVATDLASRGLDIENVASVIHYHQPLTSETYTHRNGRTARVDNDGDIYLLIGPDEDLKEYVDYDDTFHLDPTVMPDLKGEYETIYISAGKKEKLSKGDIVGFLVKTGGVAPECIGKIEVADHYSLAAVKVKDAEELVRSLSANKIKGAKRRIAIATVL